VTPFLYILCKPTFRRNVSPPSSGHKNQRARNQREQMAAECRLQTFALRTSQGTLSLSSVTSDSLLAPCSHPLCVVNKIVFPEMKIIVYNRRWFMAVYTWIHVTRLCGCCVILTPWWGSHISKGDSSVFEIVSFRGQIWKLIHSFNGKRWERKWMCKWNTGWKERGEGSR
jgi:hypothetical protein